MKRIDIALLIGLMCLGLTACDESTAGGVASASSAAKETTAEVEAAGSAGSSEAGETEAAGSAGSSEAGETEAAGTGETAGSQKIYADMDGITFGFYSGVGAWETTLKVAPDGSFKGQFNDANMGEDGEGYKNGTIYECAFTGKFSAAEKVDDTSYSAKVEALDYEKEKNGSDHYIEDQTLHIMTDPYGLSLGDDIVIYTPGKKTSELSEGFMSWMTWKIPDDAKELDQIAIYNTTGDYVFYPDFYAMGTEEPTEGAPTESKAYLNLKNSYYSQAMPPYYQTPFVPEVPEAPSKSYSSVSIENLQGRWVNRYKEGKVQVEEVLSVNGNRGRIETFMDGVQQGVWNGEGIIDIEDRSARKVCPAFRIYDDTGDAVCVIYIRWVKDKAFFDGHITLNTTNTPGATERVRFTYRNDNLELTTTARTRVSYSTYTISTIAPLLTFNNQVGGTANWTWTAIGLTTKGEFNYNWYNGYASNPAPEYILNAEIQKSLLKGLLTLAVKGYDILGQSKNLMVSDNGNIHSETLNNTLGRYIVASVTVRFGTFKGMGGGRGGPGGPGGPGRGMGGPPPGR